MAAVIWGVTTYLLVVALVGYSLFMLVVGVAAWISALLTWSKRAANKGLNAIWDDGYEARGGHCL